MLAPGDDSLMTISFSLTLNKDTISKYNIGVKCGESYISPLDELILILKLKNGPDHYITLEINKFNYTSFGMPIEVLCNINFGSKSISSLDFPEDYKLIHQVGKWLNIRKT